MTAIPLPRPKAILFDWDNTLADTWPIIHMSMVSAFEKMGHKPWTLEETKQRAHRSLRDAFPDIFGDRWEEAGKLYQDFFRQNHLDHLTPLPDALDMLNHLHADQSIYLAIVSNKMGDNLRKELLHLGWDKFFQKIIGATDAKADKPDPAPVLMALEGSGITPGKDVWFIGDTQVDMECAHNTGCLPIFYGEDVSCDPRFSHCRPHMNVRDHQELMTLLRMFG